MRWNLKGNVMQFLEVEVEPDDLILSESGKMAYMSDNIDIETKAKGGLFSSLKRSIAGESFFLVEFTSKGGTGLVAFASEFPGKIVPLELQQGEAVTAQKDAFLCSSGGTLDMEFTKKIGAGFLGGEGLALLRMEGPGTTFLNVGGEVTELTLEAGEKVRIDTGCLAAFDSGMNYDVERMKGIKNIIFGDEGLFLATLEGPGRVWIQSMPIQELAGKLGQYIGGGTSGRGAAAGLAGGALGSMMGD